MLIRSQDKETLINFNNSIVVSTMVDIGGATKIFCSYSCDDYVIGHYSSKEKAMKVLDMIQEAYANEKLVDYTTHLQQKEIEKMDDSTILALRNELMKKAVFQMPEDGSVEV